jgi:hypothetical protein
MEPRSLTIRKNNSIANSFWQRDLFSLTSHWIGHDLANLQEKASLEIFQRVRISGPLRLTITTLPKILPSPASNQFFPSSAICEGNLPFPCNGMWKDSTGEGQRKGGHRKQFPRRPVPLP